MLALHWVCILATTLDKKSIQDNPKVFRLVVWIVPVLSCSCMGFMYFVALGYAFSALRLMMLMMGECTDAFERLPLVEHAELLRNILYSGVWVRYDQVKTKRLEADKKKEHNAE